MPEDLDPKVQQLALTLKKQGLAVSMYEAIEKAKSILDVKSDLEPEKRSEQAVPFPGAEHKTVPGEGFVNETPAATDLQASIQHEDHEEPVQEEPEEPSINELMREVGVEPEQVKAQEASMVQDIKEEISEIREEMPEAASDPAMKEKVEQEMAHVAEQVNEITEAEDPEESIKEADEIAESDEDENPEDVKTQDSEDEDPDPDMAVSEAPEEDNKEDDDAKPYY